MAYFFFTNLWASKTISGGQEGAVWSYGYPYSQPDPRNHPNIIWEWGSPCSEPLDFWVPIFGHHMKSTGMALAPLPALPGARIWQETREVDTCEKKVLAGWPDVATKDSDPWPDASGLSEDAHAIFIELDDGKIYRQAPYLVVKTMVSCRFSLKPIQWYLLSLRPCWNTIRRPRACGQPQLIDGSSKISGVCRVCPGVWNGAQQQFLETWGLRGFDDDDDDDDDDDGDGDDDNTVFSSQMVPILSNFFVVPLFVVPLPPLQKLSSGNQPWQAGASPTYLGNISN